MKKLVKYLLVFTIFLTTTNIVNAQSAKERLLDAAKAQYTIAGETYKFSDDDIQTLTRYLSENTVTDAQVDTIINKGNSILNILRANNSANPHDLSYAKKQEILTLAQEASAAIGCSAIYNESAKKLEIYDSSSKKIHELNLETNHRNVLKSTGNDYMTYILIAVSILLVSGILTYKKLSNNA